MPSLVINIKNTKSFDHEKYNYRPPDFNKKGECKQVWNNQKYIRHDNKKRGSDQKAKCDGSICTLITPLNIATCLALLISLTLLCFLFIHSTYYLPKCYRTSLLRLYCLPSPAVKSVGNHKSWFCPTEYFKCLEQCLAIDGRLILLNVE